MSTGRLIRKVLTTEETFEEPSALKDADLGDDEDLDDEDDEKDDDDKPAASGRRR
jgi:hypothetical protein